MTHIRSALILAAATVFAAQPAAADADLWLHVSGTPGISQTVRYLDTVAFQPGLKAGFGGGSASGGVRFEVAMNWLHAVGRDDAFAPVVGGHLGVDTHSGNYTVRLGERGRRCRW